MCFIEQINILQFSIIFSDFKYNQKDFENYYPLSNVINMNFEFKN